MTLQSVMQHPLSNQLIQKVLSNTLFRIRSTHITHIGTFKCSTPQSYVHKCRRSRPQTGIVIVTCTSVAILMCTFCGTGHISLFSVILLLRQRNWEFHCTCIIYVIRHGVVIVDCMVTMSASVYIHNFGHAKTDSDMY